MDDLSTGPTVSFDEAVEDQSVNESSSSPLVSDFNGILPHKDDSSIMDVVEESESVIVDDRMDHLLLDPDTNLITLEWETPTPNTLLPDCFGHFVDSSAEDGFMENTLEPTEVSEDEMDFDTLSMEHRFQETAKRLAESMEKSRRTRFSLTLKSPAVAHYSRRQSLSSIVSSVEESSQQLLATFAAAGNASRSPSLSSSESS